MWGGKVCQGDDKKRSQFPWLLRCMAKYSYLKIQWYNPQAKNNTKKLVCICLFVYICILACVFFLNITNCIAYCAIYDVLKKSKVKIVPETIFSKDKIQISSWICELMQKSKSTGFVKYFIETGQWTYHDQASLIVLPYIHLKLLLPKEWILVIWAI